MSLFFCPKEASQKAASSFFSQFCLKFAADFSQFN